MDDSDYFYDDEEDEEAIDTPLSPYEEGENFAFEESDGNAQNRCKYKIFTVADLETEMSNVAVEVASVLNVSPNVTRTLLRQVKWDKAMLLEKYCEGNDADGEMFENARRSDNFRQSMTKKRKLRERPGTSSECEICFDTAILKGLACQHTFCHNCWLAYFKQKIHDGFSFITCPATKCRLGVDYESMERLLGSGSEASATLAAYKKVEEREFVDSNLHWKWCPGTGCGRAVCVEEIGCQEVHCDGCNTSFCFQCSGEWHAPLNCDLLRRWIKQCADDSETYNWLSAYTKDCPKCKTAIEKNGGCNHMTCRSTACRYEFCWVCMGDWKAHLTREGYNCNRFSEDIKSRENKAENARASLNRYLHYYNHYRAHLTSLKMEAKLYDKVAKKMEQLQAKHRFSFVETQFLMDAVTVLSRCRRTLMSTYPFVFYLKHGSNATKLLEDNQQDLQIATEELSGFLERDMDSLNMEPQELKQKVQDKARYVSKRRTILLKQCEEGFDKNEWEFAADIFIGTDLTSASGSN